MGPAQPAVAFRIYYLPFVEPLDLDAALGDQLLAFLGPATPFILVGIGFLIQQQINQLRRDREGKVAGAVAGAVASAASGAAISLWERLAKVPQEQWLKLAICLVIDFGGDATYLFPGLGEAGDVVYAPLEAFALRALFGGNLLALLGFVEEALPFADVVPTATIGWVLQTLAPDNALTSFLGIKPLEPVPQQVIATVKDGVKDENTTR